MDKIKFKRYVESKSINHLMKELLLLFLFISHTAIADNYAYEYDVDHIEIYDPVEKLNRKVFVFNSALDYILLRPLARCYDVACTDYGKTLIGNFFDNIQTPITCINSGLKFDFSNALLSLWKFFINSTLGIVGLHDVAKKIGLNVKKQDFGSTLAYYGVGSGAYLVLPILGSTNLRDAPDLIFLNNNLNPLKYHLSNSVALGIITARMIHNRAVLLKATDHISKTSVDPYVYIRSVTNQVRESQLNLNLKKKNHD